MGYNFKLRLICVVQFQIALDTTVASKRGPLVGIAPFTSGGFFVITESSNKVSGSNKYQKASGQHNTAKQITYDILY